MNTLHLKYAVEVEKAGSITQAAQNLYMAQPNLSKAIKELEEEIGYSIFKRTSSGIQVTGKGGEFLYHAHKMLEQMDEMAKIAGREEDESKHFKVSIPRGSYIANGFTDFVASLQMPEDMEITINETNAFKTMENVVNRGYNMGIIRYQKKDEEYFNSCIKNNKLQQETIWEFEYVLVMSESNPMATKEKITCDDLEEYIKITHGDIQIPHTRNESIPQHEKEHCGKTIYVYERGSQFDLLASVPSTYMWVSPIPDYYLEKNHLIQRACYAAENLYKDVLIYRKDYRLSEKDKLFQKKLYESKVEVASAKYR